MTGRQKLEKRASGVKGMLMAGMGIFLVSIIGTCFSPFLAFLAPLGVLISATALVWAYNALRCIECGYKLGNLLTTGRSQRLFALPEDLSTCPKCGLDFDSSGTHDRLVEILSTYDKDGKCYGVVGLLLARGAVRYELVLQGNAREVFAKILGLRPFGRDVGTSYRYYFVSRSRDSAADGSVCLMSVRVERGESSEKVDVPAPQSLISTLEWLGALREHDRVVAVEQVQTPA